MHPRHQTALEMAEAASAWLGALTAEQRAVAHGAVPAYDDPLDAERRRWFYTPTDHGGLTVQQQGPAQQRAAMRLVATGLSMAGYVTVATTIGLENVLDRVEGFVTRFDRERGRDPGLYYLRVFGEPGSDGPWGWRFGGHHVSLNNLVVDGELVTTTPCFMGANPASAPLLGGTVARPLARVEDLAREIVRSLTPDLAARAVLLDKAPSDVVTANRTAVSEGDRVIPPAGLWRDERFAGDSRASPAAGDQRCDRRGGRIHPRRAPNRRVHHCPQGHPGPRPRQVSARAPAVAPRHLLRPGPGQRLTTRVVRRLRARQGPSRLGRP